ncbi:hypothetical protein FZ103_05840 [Streptomonospora sp. PA3]|nr:hypothetical protein [Streptomonospora sp. PA3]
MVEVGGLLLAAGAAHLLVLSLGHSDHGGVLLVATGAALLGISMLHRWRAHRAARPVGAGAAGTLRRAPHAAGAEASDRLWRVRVAVDDVPGGLAALTAQMAQRGVDIRLLQIHPAGDEAVDDLYVAAPAGVGADVLRDAAARAGGRRPVVEPADVRDLTDTAARTLSLVAGLVGGDADLAAVLAAVAGTGDVEHRSAPPRDLEEEDLRRTVMCLPAPEGGVLVLRRRVAFTPVEFARCRAVVHTAAGLQARLRRERVGEH